MPRLEPTGVRVPGAWRPAERVLHRGLCALLCAFVCQAALGTEGTAASSAAPPAVAPATTSTASDGKGCRVVRLSDIGWTDVTATTALFSALLRHLGYRPEITVLSLPVTYASMKNRDIDVFLGNWMPSQGGDRKSYVDDRSVEVIRANLTGAKYTLAVPAYTYEAGLRSFADIQRVPEK
jgi:glycine betaine/proline transport system substrate-binding protein